MLVQEGGTMGVKWALLGPHLETIWGPFGGILGDGEDQFDVRFFSKE